MADKALHCRGELYPCSDDMIMKFKLPHDQESGLIASILRQSYASLIESDYEQWRSEVPEWEKFDQEVFEQPETIGACIFLSWVDKQIIGFASYDPRQMPKLGIIGHNCVLPEFRGNGFGKQQIMEILCRFRAMGIMRAEVSTGDHEFFVPAQCMYLSCGFRETRRYSWTGDPSENIIDYEIELSNQSSI